MRTITLVTLAFFAMLLVGEAVALDQKADKKRAKIVAMKDATLKRLVSEHPGAQQELEAAKGYAVFSSTGASLVLLHGGGGSGILINRVTGEQLFMKMRKIGVGLGLGFKKSRIVFIFKTEAAIEKFLKNGKIAAGEFNAAFSEGGQGGAVDGTHEVEAAVKMYRMTRSGVHLGAAIVGAKYSINKKLNKS